MSSILNPDADPYVGARLSVILAAQNPKPSGYIVRPPLPWYPYALALGPPFAVLAAVRFQPRPPVVEYYDADAPAAAIPSDNNPKMWRKKKRTRSEHSMCCNGGGRKWAWVPKGMTVGRHRQTPSSVIPFPADDSQLQRSCVTTVMIKNIPNQFRPVFLSPLSIFLLVTLCGFICIYVFK